jgi:hypothetical protein
MEDLAVGSNLHALDTSGSEVLADGVHARTLRESGGAGGTCHQGAEARVAVLRWHELCRRVQARLSGRRQSDRSDTAKRRTCRMSIVGVVSYCACRIGKAKDALTRVANSGTPAVVGGSQA